MSYYNVLFNITSKTPVDLPEIKINAADINYMKPFLVLPECLQTELVNFFFFTFKRLIALFMTSLAFKEKLAYFLAMEHAFFYFYCTQDILASIWIYNFLMMTLYAVYNLRGMENIQTAVIAFCIIKDHGCDFILDSLLVSSALIIMLRIVHKIFVELYAARLSPN